MQRHLSSRMLGLRIDARRTIDLAGRYGFEGVELLVRDLADGGEHPADLASLMADRGLKGGSWPLPVDWRAADDQFQRELDLLSGYAGVAARLGLDRSGTWVLPEILDPKLLGRERPSAAALDWHVDRLGAIAAILGDYGHRLGLEAIGVASSRSGLGLRFIDRLEALDPLIDALLCRGFDVGLTVDAFHLYAAGEEPAIALRRGTGAIVSVHLSDLPAGEPPDPASVSDDRRALPGVGGNTRCEDLLRLLAHAGYPGPIFAEPRPGGASSNPEDLGGNDPEATVQLAAEALASVWPDEIRADPA